ncbi:MAG TPA: hypothetical protein VNM14_24415 [Planctomycetota bacterium]|nr:hypothetical protein [Planctomycetota bacterium]
MRFVRAAGWFIAVLMIPACGPGGDSKGGSSAAASGTSDLTGPGVDLSGGGASGPSSTGGDGGAFSVRSQSAIDVTREAAPSPPALPSTPSSGSLITDLSADRVVSGTAIISADLSSVGSSGMRSITVNGGDLVIAGALRSSERQGFSLSATGAIIVSGSVRTSGGDITLRGSQVVVTGALATEGPAGSGGNGGSITIAANESIGIVGGSLSASGASGSSRGGSGGVLTLQSGGEARIHGSLSANGGGADGSGNDLHGGPAGSIRIIGLGLVVVDSTLRFRGGSARTSGAGAVGGDGGLLAVGNDASVRLFGIFDGRGGEAGAAAGGSAIRGGKGGRVTIGDPNSVASLSFQEARYVSHGGVGESAGGHGGSFNLLAFSGGILLSGGFAAEGGGSGQTSGPGGTFTAQCDIGGGDLNSEASLIVSGGSASSSAASASGGDGGRVELSAWFDSTVSPSGNGGSIVLGSGSLIVADGGDSAGAATAGKGGTVHLEIPQSHVSIAGSITARGGTALGSGSGGFGGLIWTDTDANANAVGGNITLESGGVLDASGGDSAAGTGGDAQWSTTPLFRAGSIPIAVLLDSDSVVGGPNPGGLIQNNGVIYALGGKPNGHGGDVEFHGASATSREPEPGDVRNSGDGSGGNGVFVSD